MINSFYKYAIVLMLLYFARSQSIEQIIESFSKYSSPAMITLIKSTLKSQVVESIENALDSLKNQTDLYKDQNKEIIDSMEQNLNKYRRAKNFFDEEKFLGAMLNNFKQLIELNGGFTEKRRMENMLNLIEKVMKFITDKLEDIEKNPDEEKSSSEAEAASGIIAGPSEDKEELDENEYNKENKPNISASGIIVLAVISLLIIFLVTYQCIRRKNRLRSNQIEYIAQGDETKGEEV